MRDKYANSSIVLLEVFGFAVVLILQWGLVLVDMLPFYSGRKSTPINWIEDACESAGVLIVAVTVIVWTRNALARIRRLEGMLHVCSHCKRVQVDGRWIDFEEYVLDKTDTRLSHGICQACLAEHYPDLTDASPKPDISPRI
jgi:hypothetical protein